jgi:hypothetical protein
MASTRVINAGGRNFRRIPELADLSVGATYELDEGTPLKPELITIKITGAPHNKQAGGDVTVTYPTDVV